MLTKEHFEQFEALKNKWVGKQVRICGDHPHTGKKGEVVSLDHTHAGYGFKVDLEDGESCYVFKGSHMEEVKP